MSWQQTLKWFEKQYPQSKYPRIEIVNRPGLRAVHVKNLDPAAKWEGMNLYEQGSLARPRGRVRVFVLERQR